VEVREGEVAVVMELAGEGTLKKYIQKNGKLSEDVVSKITCQILQGLSYLQINGISHKDLKPSNVLMTGNGNIQLSDYALAEIYDQRLSGKGDKVKNGDFSRGESLPYMAPEVIRHEGISEKADIWSLGCTVI
jgi:mitogen-activated protein kinase kinase kinase